MEMLIGTDVFLRVRMFGLFREEQCEDCVGHSRVRARGNIHVGIIHVGISLLVLRGA